MKNYEEIVKEYIEREFRAVEKILTTLDSNTSKLIDILLNTKGKIIFTGVGKSAHIAKKLAATFSSTGTPAFFIHSTEGLHGDLGMIEKQDTVITISNSGNTNEVINVLPTIKRIGSTIISISGNHQSKIAKESDLSIELKVDKEADSLNLAPTNSSTVALVYGDAIAMTLSKLKNFKEEDFALYHPGGALGKKLLGREL